MRGLALATLLAAPAFAQDFTLNLGEDGTPGFLIFVPFIVIDMVVASVLMSMGMMMLPPIMISLPLKLIFFVLVTAGA